MLPAMLKAAKDWHLSRTSGMNWSLRAGTPNNTTPLWNACGARAISFASRPSKIQSHETDLRVL